MNELVDAAPPIALDPAEYGRLLGFPRGHVMTGRARELASWAQSWYAENGRPWIYTRQCESLRVAPGQVTLDDITFTSPRLQQTLALAQATDAFLVAVSAGNQAEEHAQRLWSEDKPDEYFFLEIYASAVVEFLATLAGARLCAWADEHKLAVLPHYSPGYPEWDIAQQPRLLDLIARGAHKPLPCDLEVLSSGMLRPKKSLLAVFGVTPLTAQVRRLTGLVPCQNCSLDRCQFRRAPYSPGNTAAPEVAAAAIPAVPPAAIPLIPKAPYSVNPRALHRWVQERLTLTMHPDGTIDAVFRYDGTTCSNMGRPLAFLYHVRLGNRGDGYPLRAMLCTPAPEDEGHKAMCRYLSHGASLLDDVAQEKPLLGRPLDDIFTWTRPAAAAGCFCEPLSRQHKWGLALETLHYALAQQESLRWPHDPAPPSAVYNSSAPAPLEAP